MPRRPPTPISSLRLALVALVALAPAACAAPDDGPDGVLPPTAVPVDDPAVDAEPLARCTDRDPVSPGDTVVTLTVDGEERELRLHVPPGYDPTHPTPVVLNFHALGFSGEHQEGLSLMIAKADAEGFLVVHAEGTGLPRSWNAGACCAPARVVEVDDVALVNAILDDLEARLCVDARRIYATGMSNGGFLSHRLACELSERIAAVAPVAGVNGMPTCSPTRPIPVFHFHGTADFVVPYSGGGLEDFRSVDETMSAWAARNGCAPDPIETSALDDVRCVTWPACTAGAEVSLCTIDGGGHTWPGGGELAGGGHTTQTISATDEMWAFFLRHPLH